MSVAPDGKEKKSEDALISREDEEGEEEAMSYGIPDDSTVIGPSPNPSKSPDDDSVRPLFSPLQPIMS